MTSSSALDPRRVVVVVPTLNEEKHIVACIDGLMAGDPRMELVRIVVADGGSADDTVKIVEGLRKRLPNLNLVLNPKKLQSAACNLVARRVADSADYLVRCDAHSEYPPGFVMRSVESLRQVGAASVVVPMDAVGDTGFQRAAAWIVDTKIGNGGAAHRGGKESRFVDHGHHAAFDLKQFLAVGGYDETFSHNEDAEFDHRLAAAGGKIYLNADLRIAYHTRKSLPALWRQYVNYGAGRLKNLIKHQQKPSLRQAIPIMIAPALGISGGLFLLALMSGLIARWPAIAVLGLPLFAYLGIVAVVSIAGVLVLKHRTGLWSGPALAAMHVGWSVGAWRQIWRALTTRQT